MKKSIFALVLVPAILVLAACTGEAEVSPTAPATPTLVRAEDFSARANGICAEAVEQIGALGVLTVKQFFQVEEDGTYQEIADYLESFVTIEAAALDQLRALPPPGENSETFGEFLSALDEEIELTRSYAAALRAENLTGFEDFLEKDNAGSAIQSEKVNLASQAGLMTCVLLGYH